MNGSTSCESNYSFNFSDAVVIRETVRNVKIGKVETLEPGSEATVKTRIEKNDITLDFGIPRGNDGNGGNSAPSTLYTVLPIYDSGGNVLGSWHIYHDQTNDTYDVYGYASVEGEIYQTWELAEQQVWGGNFPLLIPAEYTNVFSRKLHATACGTMGFDKGGFYMHFYNASVSASGGYVSAIWSGIGTADNGCRGVGTISLHVHIEAE